MADSKVIQSLIKNDTHMAQRQQCEETWKETTKREMTSRRAVVWTETERSVITLLLLGLIVPTRFQSYL